MGAPMKTLCIFVLLLHKSAQQHVFNDQETLSLPTNYKTDWMETLDGNMFISNITIPGTHDTMALHGGAAAECQSWSLENQLLAGIRYLDLRVSGNNLKVVHGVISQHTTFADVLNIVKGFLSQHKSETVLLRVKLESKGPFPDDVANQLKNDPGCWVNNEIPQLEDVRGKIVFVQKKNFKLGVPLLETDKKGDYKVGNVEKKKAKIIEHLKQALEPCEVKAVVLNYSSGTGWPLGRLDRTPKNVAKKINPWLYSHLEGASKENIKLCFGVIAMDFPGLDLIQLIISFNK
ncbi:1-phosphatidylinositol phosphodiesterase-like [Danio rerio]|uniref:1-phosphatidylinositol phosphodiesterase-like n=1 Tax=Danio rerio TaxID=7955 RepID=A0A8M9P8K6_DANRE|nr:uncharacterized protein LOC100331378 [Danio rerio]XP_021322698.1 uncharacterized protein LOC100331378 [Danio rerio]|eukprot:XP_009290935.1 uncharacterized protein LOC100331378 [Danio rerio]